MEIADVGEVVLWLVGLELLGLAAFPVAGVLFRGWPDRGYALAKFLGLVLVAHAAWLSSILGVTGFTGPTIVVLTALLAVLGWQLLHQHSNPFSSIDRRLLLGEEAVFLAIFLGAALLRAYAPAVVGQEKPMDLMFLHSLIRADRLPVEDPWLAGYGLPYYYFGYLLNSVLAKVTLTPPAIAYNLAVASVLALAAVGAFGLATNLLLRAGASLRASALWGLLGALVLVGMGNLEALVEFLVGRGWGDPSFWMSVGLRNAPTPGAGGNWFPTDGAWWFRAARVIPNIEPDGITEFPYFSFLLGDLHPHYMALPLSILILALAAARLVRTTSDEESRIERGIRIGACGVVLGAVIPTNTWDVPVLWGAFGAASLGAAGLANGWTWPQLRPEARNLGLTLATAVLLYVPYFFGYTSQALGIGLVSERTPIGSLIILFGPLLVLPLAAAPLAVIGVGLPSIRDRLGMTLVGALGVAGVLLVLREATLALLLVGLAAWAIVLWKLLEARVHLVPVATAALVLLGLGAILVPELVFLRDVFGTRMNTVFKFYYNAWIVLALAAPLLGYEVLRAARSAGLGARLQPWLARIALGAGAALALGGALYPLGATGARTGGFAEAPTLDGMTYLRRSQPDDAVLVDWLRRTGSGARVVEAVGDDYSDAARFSTFAGTVAPMGWVGHELQWRGPVPELNARKDEVRAIYTDPTESRWRDALRSLSMDFVVVGSLERQLYGPQVDTKFEGTLETVQRAGASVVYRARP